MRTLITVTVLFGLARTVAGAGPGDVAIIVNKANPVETLSPKELKQIFSGEKARWADGVKIETFATGAVSPDHKSAIQFLFGMNEPDYQKLCMHAYFVGTPQAVPRDSGSSQAVLNLVKTTPGGIGFVRADLVDPSVRVVRIGGKAPGEAGYLLAGSK